MQVKEASKVRNRQTTWYVTSETGSLVQYIIHNKRNEVTHRKVWTCNCPDFTERKQFTGGTCKHIDEVQFFVQSKERFVPVHAQIVDVKQLVDQIVTVLKGPKFEAKQLWDILTALRGPDDGNIKLKEITTAAIRAAIGLGQNSVGAVVSSLRPFGADFDLSADFTPGYHKLMHELLANYKAQHHFVLHYRQALQALKQLGYIK
jgi:predicted nucleic acid-binding Zn finger protein